MSRGAKPKERLTARVRALLPGPKDRLATNRLQDVLGSWQVLVDVEGPSVEVLASTCEAGRPKSRNWSYDRKDRSSRAAVVEALTRLARV